MTDGLVGHWKMDESSGTAVADASGNGNTGTLTNAQETGTSDASGNSVTTMVDTDGSLSSTDDAYNNMILRFTAACGSITSGTERTITDYTGTPHTFTVATLAQAPDSCASEVRHQTGGEFGNGVGFDKANDYVSLGNCDALKIATKTVSFWANPKSSDNTYMVFSASSQNYYVSLYSSSQIVTSYSKASGSQKTFYSGDGQVISNQWHHYTVTYNVSGNTVEIKMFRDGNIIASTIDNEGYSSSYGSNFLLGAFLTSSGYFNGSLDDVRVYNRALSPDEVKQMSESGPGPVGGWKMDENVSGNGQTIVDHSGNGNNGTTDDGANNTGMDCTKQGKFGGGCELDGTDDRINAGNGTSLQVNQIVTLEAWEKSSTSDTSAIVDKYGSGGGEFLLAFTSSNNLQFISYDGVNS